MSWIASTPLWTALAHRRAPDGLVILGEGELAAKLYREVADLNGSGPKRLVRWALRQTGVHGERLQALIRTGDISRIVLAAAPADSSADLASTLVEGKLRGVEVQRAMDFYERLHRKVWLEALDPDWLVFSEGFHISREYRILKRLLDILCALTLLVLAAPLYALVALVVALTSRGPVLFRQERVGRYGQPFVLHKFRSMRVDAELDTGPVWARARDDRVTPIGGVLRRFHLDEIPQVYNVLRGDLSFVGPRPERPCFVEGLRRDIPYYELRHLVKPGITGWAQVSYPYGDSTEDAYEKLQYDLYYAKHGSLVFDLVILLRTIRVVLIGNGR